MQHCYARSRCQHHACYVISISMFLTLKYFSTYPWHPMLQEPTRLFSCDASHWHRQQQQGDAMTFCASCSDGDSTAQTSRQTDAAFLFLHEIDLKREHLSCSRSHGASNELSVKRAVDSKSAAPCCCDYAMTLAVVVTWPTQRCVGHEEPALLLKRNKKRVC